MFMKRFLVGSSLGRAALGLRNWRDLKSLPFHNPEKASMIANGLIADRLIAHLPTKGSCFLDIGAHVGSIFSAVHAVDKSIKIFAVEADPTKASFLENKFPYCHITNCAVGPETGKASLFLHDQSGFNSLVEQDAQSADKIDVEVNRLDDLFSDPDLKFETIKIDIEGAELGALIGGEKVIQRSRPTIMFESTSINRNSLGYSAEDLWEWFKRAGFEIFSPDRLAHETPPMDVNVFLDSHNYPFRTLNYFAVPVDRKTEIRKRAKSILRA